MSERDDRAPLTPEELAFVARLEEVWRAEPQDAAQRAAFDRRLEARLARRRLPRGLVPVLATAAASAAAVGVLLSFGPADPAPLSAVEVRSASSAGARLTPEQALLGWVPSGVTTESDLPDDYQALESLLYGDV